MNSNKRSYLTSAHATCAIFSSIAVLAGVVGMALSFLYMASADMRDIIAGSSGFIAGGILIGAGIISLTLLCTKISEKE